VRRRDILVQSFKNLSSEFRFCIVSVLLLACLHIELLIRLGMRTVFRMDSCSVKVSRRLRCGCRMQRVESHSICREPKDQSSRMLS
jgi:hypothetical protein